MQTISDYLMGAFLRLEVDADEVDAEEASIMEPAIIRMDAELTNLLAAKMALKLVAALTAIDGRWRCFVALRISRFATFLWKPKPADHRANAVSNDVLVRIFLGSQDNDELELYVGSATNTLRQYIATFDEPNE